MDEAKISLIPRGRNPLVTVEQERAGSGNEIGEHFFLVFKILCLCFLELSLSVPKPDEHFRSGSINSFGMF